MKNILIRLAIMIVVLFTFLTAYTNFRANYIRKMSDEPTKEYTEVVKNEEEVEHLVEKNE